MYMQEYVDSGEAAQDHRDAMRAARDAGVEDYTNPDHYDDFLGSLKVEVNSFQTSMQKRFKDFSATAKTISKNHKNAHIIAEAAVKAGSDDYAAFAHLAEE